MVDVYRKKCSTEGCGKQPKFGVAGTKTAEYCAQHTPDGMVDVKHRKCRTEGWPMKSSFRVAGTTTVEYCAQYAPDGMVDVKPRKRKAEGCDKRPSFGVAGTTAVEYCAQYAPGTGWSTSNPETLVRSRRYDNSGLLRTARSGRDGRRGMPKENHW